MTFGRVLAMMFLGTVLYVGVYVFVIAGAFKEIDSACSKYGGFPKCIGHGAGTVVKGFNEASK